MKSEPEVIVNGVHLTKGQSMTFRVALENFASLLSDKKFAKDLGENLAANYLARIDEIRAAIFSAR